MVVACRTKTGKEMGSAKDTPWGYLGNGKKFRSSKRKGGLQEGSVGFGEEAIFW